MIFYVLNFSILNYFVNKNLAFYSRGSRGNNWGYQKKRGRTKFTPLEIPAGHYFYRGKLSQMIGVSITALNFRFLNNQNWCISHLTTLLKKVADVDETISGEKVVSPPGQAGRQLNS
jgi:hypothetical protein